MAGIAQATLKTKTPEPEFRCRMERKPNLPIAAPQLAKGCPWGQPCFEKDIMMNLFADEVSAVVPGVGGISKAENVRPNRQVADIDGVVSGIQLDIVTHQSAF